MSSLDNKYIIDYQAYLFSRNYPFSDNVVDVYLHSVGGPVIIKGGIFGTQEIQSLPFDSADESFLSEIFYDLDNTLSLEFRLVSDPLFADIAIYLDTEIILEDSSTIGIAYNDYTDGHGSWEIIIDRKAITDTNYLRYALIHEIGHTLGLEHPFDDGDNDVYNNITSPWYSLYPDQTVMAYRSPRLSEWSNNYTEYDYSALVELWGPEENPVTDNLQTSFFGTSRNDELIAESGPNYSTDLLYGAAGDDLLKGFKGFDYLAGGEGNDILRAGNGRDTLTGARGEDTLYGGFGSNSFLSERDGYVDHIYIRSDEYSFNPVYGKANNNANGIKADKLYGLDPFDRLHFLGTNQQSITCRYITLNDISGNILEGIGIYCGDSIEAIYLDDNLSISQLTDMINIS